MAFIIVGLSWLLVALMGLLWTSRGALSAMVHMMCCLVGAAVAFAVWEPLALLMLDKVEGNWVLDVVWGAALAVPFVVVTVVLRLGVDKILGANTDLSSAANFVFGGLAGLVAGVITVGMAGLTFSNMRVKNEILGYRMIKYSNFGSLERAGSIPLPMHVLGAALSFLSEGSLRTGTPLGVWRPDLVEEGELLRMSFNDGRFAIAARASAFEVGDKYYTVGKQGRLTVRDLLTDRFGPGTQRFTRLDGREMAPSEPAYLAGFWVTFKAGARDKANGRIVVGNSQVRLVVGNDNDPDDTIGIHPVALVSQAEGNSPVMGRWRFDGNEVYIASVGGASEALMGFEFLVPHGYTPRALYVKGVRTRLDEGGRPMEVYRDYESTLQRDAGISSRALITDWRVPAVEQLDESLAITIQPTQQVGGSDTPPIQMSDGLPFRVGINKGNKGSLSVDESDNRNIIIDGESTFNNNEAQGRNLPPTLLVRRMATGEDTVLIQVNLSHDSPLALTSNRAAAAADKDEAPVLIDTAGQRYVAIGYVYRDEKETTIRFTPSREIRKMSEAPGMSRSRPEQKMIVVFRVSRGVQIDRFAIGKTLICRLNPPLEADRRQ